MEHFLNVQSTEKNVILKMNKEHILSSQQLLFQVRMLDLT